MGKPLKFDYYYGIEVEQFTFYRVPRLLIKDKRFRELSCEAKLLYGLMLDRLSLSLKNRWLDDQNRAFIHYTLENIVDDLCCSTGKCVKILAELDDKKGIGLIERKKQGLGKPDIIYVKNFDSVKSSESSENGEKDHSETGESRDLQDVKVQTSQNPKSRLSYFASQGLQKMEIQSSQNCNSGITKIRMSDFQKLPSNYNNHNNTDPSYTNHIDQSIRSKGMIDAIDGKERLSDYIEQVKSNIEYDHHMKYDSQCDKELYGELFEVICEMVCIRHETVRISGENYPYDFVREKFLKLNESHLQYVIDCMQKMTGKITNIKAYMVTALFNAPSTMKHYYQQEVNHDMYGVGWQKKRIT